MLNLTRVPTLGLFFGGNTKNTVYKFSSLLDPTLAEVGGKGLSLIECSRAGFPVPMGFVLTVEFFKPWFDSLQHSKEWSNFLQCNEKSAFSACERLKDYASKLVFSEIQQQDIFNILNEYDQTAIFAVRSSSPEEDLEGSSFAGGYETVLGVTTETIELSVKKAFISCLDHRVFVYKKENGFDIFNPTIAVVVQEQITSDISGVGFSINPINNSYDESVINSNWGLGETVVSGIVTPDTYVVDKIRLNVKSVRIGTKEKVLWLDSRGGTRAEENYRAKDRTLSDEQIISVSELINKVESTYNKPVDIEWAFSHKKLYLLQARPITGYVPVAPEMQTLPNEKKKLYLDVTISVQGLYKPISNMGTSIYNTLPRQIGKMLFLREIKLNPMTSLLWIAHGKFFLNLSAVFNIISKEKYAKIFSIMDPLAASTIKSVDENEYKQKTKTKFFKFRIFLTLLQVFPFILRAFLFPKYAHKLSQKKLKEFDKYARNMLNQDTPLTDFIDKLFYCMLRVNSKYSAPIAIIARILQNIMNANIPDASEAELKNLCLALPNNVTTEMGFALFDLYELIPNGMDEGTLFKLLKQDALPLNFMKAWQDFLNKYGHRCPQELDPATPRYRDNPEALIKLLYSMLGSENPKKRFAEQQNERNKTFSTVLNRIRAKQGVIRSKIFSLKYQFVETFAGYRETHKYYLILIIDLIRQRILKEADDLYKAGRLKSVVQVFDLTLEELKTAMDDDSMDLNELAKQSSSFIKRLEKVPHPPTVFDSRGLILRPSSPKVKENEIVGTAISSGTITGRVKVLHSPTEKPFNKGEILVARATDPGWTPLFINASAVVLEVGGILQHGALVAREYGLPCIAGIENATTIFKDGDLIEVDGSSGIIRYIKPSM